MAGALATGEMGLRNQVRILVSQQIANATNGNAGIPAEQGDDQERLVLLYVVYSSVVRALDCESRGRGFKSR